MKIRIKIKSKGQKQIEFSKGGLHRSLHISEKEKIPESKKEAALHGEYGPKAQKQAQFAKNVLTGK